MRVVVLGAGEVGRYIAQSLSREADVTIVDVDTASLSIAEDELDVMTLHGDVTYRNVLAQAEVASADAVLAMTGNDAINVTAAVLSYTLGARRVVVRVDDSNFYNVDLGIERGIAGVDAFVCASRLIGGELLRRVTSIHTPFTATQAGGSVHVALVDLEEGTPIGRTSARVAHLVRAVIRGGSVRAASEITAYQAGDRLLIVGTPSQVASSARPADNSRAVLIGGGDVGLQMARSLQGIISDIRVVDASRTRCEALSSMLPRVTVLHGDGTNLGFLREERVGLAEFQLSVTGSDEVNLMASLLARELGARHTFSLVHRPGYAPVYNQLGIEGTTSAHEILAASVRWLLPGRWVISQIPLPGVDWDLLEIRVPKKLDRTLDPRDLPLGAGAIVVGRIDPRTGTQGSLSAALNGGEHLLLVAQSGARRTIERGLERLHRSGANG